MWWIIHSVGMALSWYFTDVSSSSGIENSLFPFLFVVFLLGLIFKAAFAIGRYDGRGGRGKGGDVGYFGGFGSSSSDGGSDGGGGGSDGGGGD